MKIYNNNLIKLSSAGGLKVVIFVCCLFGIIIPLFIQVAILLQQSAIKDETLLTSHKILYEDLELKKNKVESLEKHLEELEFIKIKTLNSLMELDVKRTGLLQLVKDANKEKEEFKEEVKKVSRQLEKMRKELSSAQQSKRHKFVTNIVYVGIPQNGEFTFGNENKSNTARDQNTCTIQKCFDFSKCSFLRRFTFYVYKPISEHLNSLYSSLTSLEESSNNWKSVCIFLVLIDVDNQSTKDINSALDSLPSWRGSGKNHLLILVSKRDEAYCNVAREIHAGHAIFMMSKFCSVYRHGYDFLTPNFHSFDSDDNGNMRLPLYPIQRKNFLFFASELMQGNKSNWIQKYISELNTMEDVFVNTNCNNYFVRKCISGWCICDFFKGRQAYINSSLFVLIPIDYNNPLFFDEIIDCFKNGAIPVVTGLVDNLPFSDVIDWRLASIAIPLQRLPELLLLLRSMPLNDVISLKLQGQFLYTTYFTFVNIFLKTVLTNLCSKIGLPPTGIGDFSAVYINNGTGQTQQPTAFSSPKFSHNFSYIGKLQYSSWNRYPGALRLYPVTPWNEAAPSKIQFLDEGKDYYMPIGDGTGGDGVAFSRSIGGDHPVEQFTVLMLTYDRETILMEALQRLSGMKYLNKVIVVWNHPIDPGAELEWPDIGIKIEVIRAGKNSLNNRFIPYENIETEAILSMDDDIYLRHDEIELAFRVWRENRDRLVGFPGRHHSYNSTSKSFYYNSEHSCELSLVLTGGAFFHKYYSYIYTYDMNSAIREMVDDYMNCEDIAMNFLVAHITRKPPIKVTSRWTFRCPGCPVALSADAHHYEERNKCMAYFEKLYGYNPLKRTQFRADSILFKTRLPSTMTKCFQFV